MPVKEKGRWRLPAWFEIPCFRQEFRLFCRNQKGALKVYLGFSGDVDDGGDRYVASPRLRVQAFWFWVGFAEFVGSSGATLIMLAIGNAYFPLGLLGMSAGLGLAVMMLHLAGQDRPGR